MFVAELQQWLTFSLFNTMKPTCVHTFWSSLMTGIPLLNQEIELEIKELFEQTIV